MTPPEDSKTKERNELRRAIIEAARRAFCKQGIRGMRMDDLAAELAMSKRTIYELFADKETLLIEVLKEDNKKKEIMLERMLADSPNVITFILRFHEWTSRDLYQTNIRFFTEVERYPKVKRVVKQLVRKRREDSLRFYRMGVEQGVLTPDLNYEVINILTGQFHIFFRSPELKRFSMAEIFDTSLLLFVRGIATPKGLEIINRYIAQPNPEKEK